ncbi:hypothetical protein BKA67DRAFT_588758 [Truncatella angustata]|uniref:Secreted protein n=1 Tax=Truncatella angustata TaxID=152316 RepID=A0A9P8RE07_9PEZI|nr:uncharacterized protein BKA67DRAFT_588758 [Truncatella angustata]KAH6638531.1 hypothetical protein BKA67DRAFT_588758 [Truncatella angustata]
MSSNLALLLTCLFRNFLVEVNVAGLSWPLSEGSPTFLQSRGLNLVSDANQVKFRHLSSNQSVETILKMSAFFRISSFVP